MEADASFTFNPKVTVGWLNAMEVWGYGGSVPLNTEGIAVSITSGNNFVIMMKFEYVMSSLSLTYIKVRYKMTDLRGIRGVYAPPLRGPK